MDFTEGTSLYKSFSKKERRAFMIGASCLIPLFDTIHDASPDLKKGDATTQSRVQCAKFEANRLRRRALATSSSSYASRSTSDFDATSTHQTSSTNPTSEASEENHVPPKIKALAWMCALRNFNMPKDSESRSSSSSSSSTSSSNSRTSSESIESFFMDHHLMVIQDEVAKVKTDLRMGEKLRREFDRQLAVLEKGGQERTGWDYVKHAIQEVHTIEFSPSEEEEEEEDEDDDDDEDEEEEEVARFKSLRRVEQEDDDEEDEAQFSDGQNDSSASSDSLSPTSLALPTPSLSAEPLRPKRLFAPLLSPSLATNANATLDSSPSSSSSSSIDEPLACDPPAKRLKLGGSGKVPHWIRIPAGFDKLLEVKEDEDGVEETLREIQELKEDEDEAQLKEKRQRVGDAKGKGKARGRQRKG